MPRRSDFLSPEKHPFFQTNLLCRFHNKRLILLGFDGFRENCLEFAKTTVLKNSQQENPLTNLCTEPNPQKLLPSLLWYNLPR